jgi:2-polyprenyl-3-methyl-5-hydroxy-6-metoxy-1,4-benzoquinol methylase
MVLNIKPSKARNGRGSHVTEQYDPSEYWERRLSKRFNLRGVGHISYSEGYNTWLYRRKKRCLEDFFGGVDLQGKDVLDIGSGTGFFVEWYLARKARRGASSLRLSEPTRAQQAIG